MPELNSAQRKKLEVAEREKEARRELGRRRPKSKAKPQYHRCRCGSKIRVEFKFCRHCNGIKARRGDVLDRRVPGSFGSRG